MFYTDTLLTLLLLQMFYTDTLLTLPRLQILAHALINSIQQAQVFVRLQQRKSEGPQSRPAQLDPSVAQAHKVAADILNLSQSDLEDLLSGKGSPEVTKDEVFTERSFLVLAWAQAATWRCYPNFVTT